MPQTKTRHISVQPSIESILETTFTMLEVATYAQQVAAGIACHLRIVTDEIDAHPALRARVFKPIPLTQKGPEAQSIKIASEDGMVMAL